MREETLGKIKDAVKVSSLSESEKGTLINVFSKFSDDDASSLLVLIQEKPEFLRFLNENFQAKQKAFSTSDKSVWEKILEEEKRFLTEIDR